MFGNSVSCANHTFPGTGYIHNRELFSDHHLDPNTLHLFVHQGSFKKGSGELDLSDGPVPKAGIGPGLGPVWACAQGRHEAGPRARMGQGSRCRTDPYSILLVRCMLLKMSKKPLRIQTPSIFTYIACGSKALSQQLWYSFLFRLQFFGFTNKKASILNGKLTLVDVMKWLETLQLINVLFLISLVSTSLYRRYNNSFPWISSRYSFPIVNFRVSIHM